MQTFFWIAFTILFYTYLGYGLLVFALSFFLKRKSTATADFYPPLTLVIPAYNEELFIRQKIENCLALNYPKDQLKILFITDGSTDRTAKVITDYPQINLLHQQERRGKTAAINRAMAQVTTPFVVFTDANTLLQQDSLINMMRHYCDAAVGGVSGEKRIYDKVGSAVGFGERLYWQYESLLKKADALFYTVIGAAGELYSIRTNLFTPVEEGVILDDFVISARICLQGYRFVYEEKAFAVETSSATIKEEQKRKIRISAGCFQAMLLLKGLLNPTRHFPLAFQYISHRVLRWTLCPLLLPLLLATSAYLFLQDAGAVYTFFFLAQAIFYVQALSSWLLLRKTAINKLLLIPYYFVFMNVSLYIGFLQFLRKKQSVLWPKADRKLFF